jgi:hypothetical protein
MGGCYYRGSLYQLVTENKMIRKIRTIYDFFRLWIMWGDRKEAWQDANIMNDSDFRETMKEFDKNIENYLDNE